MNDIRLSKHFKLSEFIKSSTATERGIDNTLASTGSPESCQFVISNLQALCENVLEPLREYANTSCPFKGNKGQIPIIISSCYRCAALNLAVGGVANSNHLDGYAADIHIPDVATGTDWFNWMRNHLLYDELIKERESASSTSFWIHVAFRQDKENRMKVKENLVKRK